MVWKICLDPISEEEVGSLFIVIAEVYQYPRGEAVGGLAFFDHHVFSINDFPCS
jgi:hypothetical protein